MSYRDKFPKGPEWKESDGNKHGVETIGYLKEKVTGYNKEDVLSDKLIVVDVKDMKRKELELFADRMRIDRNSFSIKTREV